MRALARRDVTTRGKRETLPLLHAAPHVSALGFELTEIVPASTTGFDDRRTVSKLARSKVRPMIFDRRTAVQTLYRFV
jgi:hypothetical protein